MKFASQVALGLAIAAGGSLVLAAPTFAQDQTEQKSKEKKVKEKKPKEKRGEDTKAAKTPTFSKDFLPVIQAADKAAKEKRFDDVLSGLAAGEAKAANAYEKHWVERYRLIAYANKGDKAAQFKAVQAMLATGGLPADEVGRFNYQAGSMAFEMKNYAEAVKYYSAAEAAGFKDDGFYISLGDAHYKMGNYAAGSAALEKAIAQETAAGRKAPESWYRVSIREASKAKNTAETAKWSRAMIRAYPTPQIWNQGLVLYRDFSKLPSQLQIDVFRLMHSANVMAGGQDYIDYGALAMLKGMPGPGESFRIIQEGIAKGLFKEAALANYVWRPTEAAVKQDRIELAAEEKRVASATDGKSAYNVGQAYLGYGDNAKAVEFLDIALKKGGTFVDVNATQLRRGIALTRLGRKAEAKAAFEAAQGPQKEIAGFWLLFLEFQP